MNKSLRLAFNLLLFIALLPMISIMYVYAARGAGVVSEYTISFISPYCFLVDGASFNVAVKTATNSSASSYQTTDSTIEHIVFDNWSDSVYGSQFDWDTSSNINVDVNNANIRVFYDNSTKTAYVLGTDLIASRDCAHMFEGFTALKTVDFRNFNSVESVSHESMFSGCSSLTNVLNDENIATNLSTSTKNMFLNCSNLSGINSTEWRTPNVTTMNAMFKNSGVTSANISSFDARLVTNFDEMFAGCTRLQGVTATNTQMPVGAISYTMNNMFLGCTGLVSLDLTGLNTVNATSMQGVFKNCTALTNLTLPNFSTVNVVDFTEMFANCSSLTSVNLLTFSSEKATTFTSMFAGSGIEQLNLGTFDTSSATTMDYCFANMPNLTKIEVSNLWTVINVTSSTNMFLNSTNIKGSRDTVYNSSKVDKEYAIVDLAPEKPGYLSAVGEQYRGVLISDEFGDPMGITYVSTSKSYILPTGDEYDYYQDSSGTKHDPGDKIELSMFSGSGNIEFTMYVKRYTVSMSNGGSNSYGSYVRRTVSYTYHGTSKTIYNGVTSASSTGTAPAGAVVTVTVSSTNTSSYTNPRVTVSPTSVTLNTVSQYSEYNFTMPSEEVTLTFSSSYEGGFCVASGSMITLADGSQKRVDDMTLDDEMLTFNHETGEFTHSQVNFIEYDGIHEYNVINLVFSDGTTSRIIYEHGFFDLDENKYVYIHEDDCTSFIGHRFVKLENNQNVAVTLTDAFVTTENVGCYSIVCKYYLDYYTDNLLSMPGGITGLFNIFDYDENLKFVNMEEELEEYGVFTYEDFAEFMDEETFLLYPIPHLKVALAKGIINEDMMLYLIARYT